MSINININHINKYYNWDLGFPALNYQSCTYYLYNLLSGKNDRTKKSKITFRCSTNDYVSRNIYLWLKLLIVVYLLKSCSLVSKLSEQLATGAGSSCYRLFMFLDTRNAFNNTSRPTLCNKWISPWCIRVAYPPPAFNAPVNITLIIHIMLQYLAYEKMDSKR